MPEQPRTQRCLSEDITHAQHELTRWREDGDLTKIQFWLRRRDQLLDRWNEVADASNQESENAQFR